MSSDRLLVIDADLPKRLAVELNSRCRPAIHVATLGLAQNVKDPELLRCLAAHYADQPLWVLITGDDRMPAQHGPVIQETAAAIATIHPVRPQGVTEDGWYRDVTRRDAQVGSYDATAESSDRPTLYVRLVADLETSPLACTANRRARLDPLDTIHGYVPSTNGLSGREHHRDTSRRAASRGGLAAD